MSKGIKQAQKASSSNRFVAAIVIMPVTLGILLYFLPPHMKPGSKDGALPVIIEKVKFLMSNHPPLGIFVIALIVVGIGAIAKLMNPGREIGDTSNLSDFEGK